MKGRFICCYHCDDCNFATQIYLKGRRHEGSCQLNWSTNRFNGLNICMSCMAHLCSVHTLSSSHVRDRPTLKCFLNSRININKNNKNKFQNYSCHILNILRAAYSRNVCNPSCKSLEKTFCYNDLCTLPFH